VGNAAKLIAEKLLPPFGDAGMKVPPYDWTLKPYTIMGDAGIERGMGSTGERPDIGLVTEHQARAIMHMLGLPNGSAMALRQVLDQAEAAGSMPLHWRDHETGKPVTVLERPTFDTHPNNVGEPGYMNPGSSPWQLDSSHFPAVSYLPFLLTGDLYHLEEVQFQAAWTLAHYLYKRVGTYGPQLYEGQERGYAWSLRTLFQAAKISPDRSDYLLPKSYFVKLLANTHAYFLGMINSTDPYSAVFGVAGNVPLGSGPEAGLALASPWMGSMLAAVLAWGIKMGFTEWTDVLDWKLTQLKSFISGKSGWNRWVSSPYHLYVADASGTKLRTWGAAYSLYAKTQPTGVPGTPNVLYCPNVNGGLQYPSYQRAAILMAIQLGRPGLQAAYDWFNEEIRLQSFRRGNSSGFAAKWSLV
jgi:hypothetical protein